MNISTRLTLAIAALALAGCTAEPGTPVPTDAPSASAPTSKPTNDGANEAPRVKDPLDAAKFIESPCSLLTAQQATKFGLESEGTQEDGTKAPFCSWGSRDGGREDYSVGFKPGNKKGLSDNYRANKDGAWAYFEPTTVSGYPAAFEDTGDRRDKGYCGLVVGVRDELIFAVTSQGGPGREACDKVKEIAGEVIATMKAGA